MVSVIVHAQIQSGETLPLLERGRNPSLHLTESIIYITTHCRYSPHHWNLRVILYRYAIFEMIICILNQTNILLLSFFLLSSSLRLAHCSLDVSPHKYTPFCHTQVHDVLMSVTLTFGYCMNGACMPKALTTDTILNLVWCPVGKHFYLAHTREVCAQAL